MFENKDIIIKIKNSSNLFMELFIKNKNHFNFQIKIIKNKNIH